MLRLFLLFALCLSSALAEPASALVEAPDVPDHTTETKGATAQATHGKTDGEPGTNATAHCCGMKGLGGATVEVLCHPDQIALGKDFTVNVKYRTDIPRPVDVHVDVLNAQTKKFYAGKWQEMDEMEGQVSLTITMADEAQEPFLWKVFVTPRGEPFPNMLAETGFVAHLGPTVEGDCKPIETKGDTPEDYPQVDYVMLRSVPRTITAGSDVPVEVDYDLVSDVPASLAVTLMRKGPNTLISGNAMDVEPGKHTMTIDVPVPSNVTVEPVYIVATMTPVGKTWDDRLSEDRTYAVKLDDRRMFRRI